MIWNRSYGRLSGINESLNRECEEIVQSSLNENVRLSFRDVNWQDYEFTLQAKKEGGSEGF
ncbi:hypothetical protein JW824_05280 [bacterium]|nr:hypothetical protein [bacterium]